jgi:hypothetical protein
LGARGLRAVLAFTAGVFAAGFFTALVSGNGNSFTLGVSTLYGTGVSTGAEPKSFLINDNIVKSPYQIFSNF